MVSRILTYESCLKFVSSRYLFNNKTWSERAVWYFICGVTAQFKCHTLFPPALIFMTVNNRGLYERKLNNKFQISALSIITHEVIKYRTMPLKSFFFLVFLCSSFKFRPFFPNSTVSGAFSHIFNLHWQRLFHHYYNDECKFWWYVLHVRPYVMTKTIPMSIIIWGLGHFVEWGFVDTHGEGECKR